MLPISCYRIRFSQCIVFAIFRVFCKSVSSTSSSVYQSFILNSFTNLQQLESNININIDQASFSFLIIHFLDEQRLQTYLIFQVVQYAQQQKVLIMFHLSGLANQSSLPSFLQHVFKEELQQEQIIGYYVIAPFVGQGTRCLCQLFFQLGVLVLQLGHILLEQSDDFFLLPHLLHQVLNLAVFRRLLFPCQHRRHLGILLVLLFFNPICGVQSGLVGMRRMVVDYYDSTLYFTADQIYFHLSLGQHAQALYLVRLDALQLPFIQFLPILKQDKAVILPQYCEFVAKDFLQSPLLRSKYHRSTFIPQKLHPQVLSALIFCHIHHHIIPVFGGHFQLPQPSRQDIFVPQAQAELRNLACTKQLMMLIHSKCKPVSGFDTHQFRWFGIFIGFYLQLFWFEAGFLEDEAKLPQSVIAKTIKLMGDVKNSGVVATAHIQELLMRGYEYGQFSWHPSVNDLRWLIAQCPVLMLTPPKTLFVPKYNCMRKPTSNPLHTKLLTQWDTPDLGDSTSLTLISQLPMLIAAERIHPHAGIQQKSEIVAAADLFNCSQYGRVHSIHWVTAVLFLLGVEVCYSWKLSL